MDICLVSNTPVGGFKSFVENIVSLLLREDCNVTILFLNQKKQFDILGVKIITYDISEHKSVSWKRYYFKFRSICERLLYRFNPHRLDRENSLKHALFCAQLGAAHTVESCNEMINLSEFDCVISTEEILCNYFLSKRIIAKRKIGYIHPDYIMAHFNKGIDRTYFKRLDKICAVSNANAKSLLKSFPKYKDKIVGIPNPIDVNAVIKKASDAIDCLFEKDRINIITVCRLDNSSKALDRLLNIADRLKNAGDLFFWRIIGDGSYLKEMQSIIKKSNLQQYVVLLGYKDNPLPFVKGSDLFVLQSYYEGYPMSVCESLIVGTPVLITDYPSASEQVEDGVDGYVVNNDADSIYEKLHYIINHKEELTQVKQSLSDKDINRFNTIDRILKIVRGEALC